MQRFLLLLAATSIVACSGGSESTGETTASTTASSTDATTAGDESTTASPRRIANTGPTLLAVPLPGVERSALRAELQQLWTRIEVAIAITPPDAPAASDEQAIADWIAGPYTDWVRRRYTATQEAFAVTNGLTDLGDVERGLAVTLVAYAYEDMAASVRGIAVPESIASDSRLIGIFRESIDRGLLPVARQAAIAYDGCIRLFETAADPAWGEWAPFCGGHLDDLREVFGRYERPEATPAP